MEPSLSICFSHVIEVEDSLHNLVFGKHYRNVKLLLASRTDEPCVLELVAGQDEFVAVEVDFKVWADLDGPFDTGLVIFQEGANGFIVNVVGALQYDKSVILESECFHGAIEYCRHKFPIV